MTDTDALLAEWRERYAEPTSGWDVSSIDAVVEGQPPWSYDALARGALAGACSALDMGTGGGEVLLGLRAALPADTVATEGWPPNLPVATDALAPYGIDVVAYDAEQDVRMPFDDGRFDVVLNRHVRALERPSVRGRSRSARRLRRLGTHRSEATGRVSRLEIR